MKTFTFAVLMLVLFSPSFANAEDDACGAVICLAGGQIGGECSSFVQKFFGITVFKKGKFKPDATANERKSYLSGSCPLADPGSIGTAISKFGKVLR